MGVAAVFTVRVRIEGRFGEGLLNEGLMSKVKDGEERSLAWCLGQVGS